MEIISFLISSGLMSWLTTYAKKYLWKRGIVVQNKQLYAFVSLIVWIIYVVRLLFTGEGVMDASTMAVSASLLAQTVYNAFKKIDTSLLPNSTNEIWSEPKDK